MLRYVGSRKILPGKTLTRKIPTHQTQHIVRGPVSHLILPFINNKITNCNFSIPLIIHRLSFTRNKSVLFGFFMAWSYNLNWGYVLTSEVDRRLHQLDHMTLSPKGFWLVIVHCWLISLKNFLSHGFSITTFYFFFLSLIAWFWFKTLLN